MIIKKIGSNLWHEMMAESAHFVTFGETGRKGIERCDFAYLVIEEDTNEVAGYVSCIEMDGETVYWQYGGAMPDKRNTYRTMYGYRLMISRALEEFERVTTRIENTNITMLKMAMAMGFLIVGTWNFKNKIYLELLLERDDERSC